MSAIHVSMNKTAQYSLTCHPCSKGGSLERTPVIMAIKIAMSPRMVQPIKISHLCCRRGTRAKYARQRNDDADRLHSPNLMEELCDPNRQQKKCQQAQDRMRTQQTNIE